MTASSLCALGFGGLLLASGGLTGCGPGASGPAAPARPRSGAGASSGGQRPLPAWRGRARQALRKNLAQYRHRLRRCHELAMAEDYRVGGRVVLRLTVGAAGVVVSTRVERNASRSTLLGRCVARVAEGFVFPSSDQGHPVRVALRFAAPAEKYTVRLDDVPPRRLVGRAVTAKRLLTARNVTGGAQGLAVVRLEPGARYTLPASPSPLGLYVLRGSLALNGARQARHPGDGRARRTRRRRRRGHTARRGSSERLARGRSTHMRLARGRPVGAPLIRLAESTGATLVGAGRPVEILNPFPRRAAFLLFSAASWEGRALGGGPAASPGASAASRAPGSPGTSAATSAPRAPGAVGAQMALLVRGPAGTAAISASASASAALRLGPGRVPLPVAVTVRPGARARLNPGGAPASMALLVIEGALWVTVRGVRLPAEAGMAVSLPRGTPASAVCAIRRPARFVAMGWPASGAWRAARAAPLLIWATAPLPRPLPRPRALPPGGPVRLPGMP